MPHRIWGQSGGRRGGGGGGREHGKGIYCGFYGKEQDRKSEQV